MRYFSLSFQIFWIQKYVTILTIVASKNGTCDNRKIITKDNKFESLTVHVRFHIDIVTCSLTIFATEPPGLIITNVFAIHGLYSSIANFTKRQFFFDINETCANPLTMQLS